MPYRRGFARGYGFKTQPGCWGLIEELQAGPSHISITPLLPLPQQQTSPVLSEAVLGSWGERSVKVAKKPGWTRWGKGM